MVQRDKALSQNVKIEDLGLTVHVFSTLHEAFQTIRLAFLHQYREAIEHAMEEWVSQDDVDLGKGRSTMPSCLHYQGYSQIYGWGASETHVS